MANETSDPLAQLSVAQIRQQQKQFNDVIDAYVSHREAPMKAGVQRAPFNGAKFWAKFKNVYNGLVVPLVGLFGHVTLPPLADPNAPQSNA